MWQINRITKDTLLNISKFSNKVLKVAQFIQETNQPFLIQNLLSVSNNTDQIEILNAFDKDLTRTVNDFYEMQRLLITVDNNGYVKELDNEEKNIKNLFGDNYDVNSKILKLPTINLNLSQPLTKEAIRNNIIEAVLDLTHDKYKELQKIKEQLKDINKEDLITEHDKIRFLTNKTDIDFIKTAIDKINVYTNSFVEIRKNLDFEEKDLIDSKITSGRTMVDGILPNSTYISKKEGIYQISTIHKKDNKDNIDELLKEIEKEIIESGYISGVEIDQDTDLDKFLFMLKKVKNFHLNVDMEFELKTRKLGNYMANGMYFHNDDLIEQMGYHSDIYNIVSVDVNSPSSLIHELTHLIDGSNKEFLYAPERLAMINHFKDKIFIPQKLASKMSDGYRENLFSPNEIIARLGEIGYILNKVGYIGHKNEAELENFFKKSQMMEMIETAGDKEIPVVHSIDFYRKNDFMFFDINNLKEEEFLAIKEYYKSYYNVLKNDFKTLKNSNILENLKKNALKSENKEELLDKEEKTNNRFSREDNPISKINLDNIEDLLKHNEEDKIFTNKELASYLSKEFVNINRTKIGEDSRHYAISFKIIEKAFKYAINTQNKELEKELFNSFAVKVNNSYNQINELNPSVSNEDYISYYLMNNRTFTENNGAVFSIINRDMFKRMQSLSSNKNEEVSYINTKIYPEMEVDRKLLSDQIKNRLSFLKDYDKKDIFLHKTLFDISLVFRRYSEQLEKIHELNRLEEKQFQTPSYDQSNFEEFSTLLKSTLVIENERKVNDFKSNLKQSIDYYHRGYSKRPTFSLKLDDLNEEFLLNNFEKIKQNIKDIPKALEKNKGFSEKATDKQKLSLISKLSFKNFEQEYIVDFINNLDVVEINKEKRVDIYKGEKNSFYYRMGEKSKLINSYIRNNSIGLDEEMTGASLRMYAAELSSANSTNEKINEKELFEKSIKTTIEEYIDILRKSIHEPKDFLIKNQDTLKFLKVIQKDVVKFLVEKDILQDYLGYLNNNDLNKNLRRVRQTNTTIKNLLNLTSIDILKPEALNILESHVKNNNNKKNKLN